jgi:hypothetical protein
MLGDVEDDKKERKVSHSERSEWGMVLSGVMERYVGKEDGADKMYDVRVETDRLREPLF